jgi:hypothetical protein
MNRSGGARIFSRPSVITVMKVLRIVLAQRRQSQRVLPEATAQFTDTSLPVIEQAA